MSDRYITFGARIEKSPFFEKTLKAGAQHFTIYNRTYLPTSYGNPQQEYERLTQDVSLWDVGCQRQVEITGKDARSLANYMTTRDLSTIKPGIGLYAPLCNHQGHLINDPIVLCLHKEKFWFSIADSDILLWAQAIAGEKKYNVTIKDPNVAPLALQGPKAQMLAEKLCGESIKTLTFFQCRNYTIDDIPLVVAKSGWSGQGGYEFYLKNPKYGEKLWDLCMEKGKEFNIGPGNPNHVERIESGLLSYKTDHEKDANPLELRLEKYVQLDTKEDFIGKNALQNIKKNGIKRHLCGAFIDGAPIKPNQHPLPILNGNNKVGTIRAAAWSWKLQRNIAVIFIKKDNDKNKQTNLSTQLDDTTKTTTRTLTLTTLPFIKPAR